MEYLKNIHSYWAYLVVILLFFAVINALIALGKKRTFDNKDLRIGLFTLIVSHIQLLIGLALYFGGGYSGQIGGEVMKDAADRFVIIEHPVMMILAIVLITIGWSKHKKKTEDLAKFKSFAIFYGIALVFVASRIPWDKWPAF